MSQNGARRALTPDSIKLKRLLDAMRQKMNLNEFIRNDPVQFVHRFKDKEDIEIAGFFSAHLAFGRVGIIIKNLEKLFGIMEWHPTNFIKRFSDRGERHFSHFAHRFVRGKDIVKFIYALKEIYLKKGGLEEFFMSGFSSSDSNVLNAIQEFSHNFYSLGAIKKINKKEYPGIYFLIPPPGSHSAYKRLNLFLRWMVRSENGLDTGLWTRIKPSQLIIPLDTHIARLSKNLGLTTRKTQDMKMAIEITENLKKLDPEDPLKYDFVLCHMGISEGCTGVYNKKICPRCSVVDLCLFFIK